MTAGWSRERARDFHMTRMLPSLRYERKFVAEGPTLAAVLATIGRHPSAFSEIYPARVVNNLYLDSAGRCDYHDHINGAANRSKTRVRWYGPQTGRIGCPMLERKVKRGLASGKEVHALPALSLNGGPLQALLKTAFEETVLPEMLRSVLRHFEPALFNRYRRHYFVSRDGRFRLTVDFDLQFASARPNNGSAAFLPPSAPIVIIELKFEPHHAENADLVTNALPFRLTRCSKYVLGIQRMAEV
jgi:hypothetical protein